MALQNGRLIEYPPGFKPKRPGVPSQAVISNAERSNYRKPTEPRKPTKAARLRPEEESALADMIRSCPEGKWEDLQADVTPWLRSLWLTVPGKKREIVGNTVVRKITLPGLLKKFENLPRRDRARFYGLIVWAIAVNGLKVAPRQEWRGARRAFMYQTAKAFALRSTRVLQRAVDGMTIELKRGHRRYLAWKRREKKVVQPASQTG